MSDNNTDHIIAIETLLECLLPVLIEASPNRAKAVALLHSWADRETGNPEEVELGNMAETVLTALPPA